ncbi:SusC/RagA family TonB-linked outer membrane protein [Marinilabilia rubra]|uniref:SusC/RagA family TonB-linked outer membrane protein n=2 Tax=Marinilabilia rubra TaxID=2162893 RepID=A0A2U2B466_9BACT|nr:SusC/RagA family TonB-linked outer membrane protein [Marinilabilia rubra]
MCNLKHYKFMKKSRMTLCRQRRNWEKIYRVMKLSLFMLVLFGLTLSAENSHGQKRITTLSVENATILDVFRAIEKESDFGFFFKNDQLDLDKRYSFEVENTTVEELLASVLADDAYSFKVIGENVVILREDVPANQQQFTVQGTVTDTGGEPIPGVNIVVEGTTTGTITDIDGNYTLSVEDPNTVLLFSFVGFEDQRVEVNGRDTIDVVMESDVSELDEVVVVGYGTQRKSDVTGSVGTASGDEILEKPSFNALQGLRGKVSGVNIFTNSGSPTGSTRVMIRGIGTINSSSEPLYVVDGVVMENFDLMNPNNIESIEVLKDASATAIYGARGANGVLLVTTKRGREVEGVTVSYDTYVSIGTLRKKMDLLNAEEWMEVLRKGYDNAPKYNSYAPGEEPVLTTNDPRLFDAQGNPRYDTDWQEEATRTAVSHNHQLSVQHGGENSSFGAFLNYSDNEGIMLNSWMKRVNAKMVYDAKIKDWLSFGMNLSVNKTWENSVEEGGGHQMPRRSMIEMPPIFPVKFPDGSWSNTFSISDAYGLEAIPNPVHVLKTQERLNNNTQIFGNAFFTFHIADGLDLKTQLGIDNNIYEWRYYSPTDLINISAPNGNASIDNSRRLYWQQETFLNYDKVFGAHRLSAVLGLSWQERTYRSNGSSTSGFADNFFKYNNLGAASDPNPPSSYAERWAMNSYFLRASYTYNDRYLLTFTGRADGSSRFGEDNKYGYFPSAGLGWIVSNEDFMNNNSLVSLLKLRTSYGITGNTEIGTYRSLATVGSGTVLINGGRETSSSVNRLPNPELEWEKTEQFNVGMDLGLFDNRISMELDYYYKLTRDLLLNRPVPHSTGFGSVIDNIGSVSNQGIDFMLNTTNIQNNDLQWTSSLNLNFNKNQIEELGENDEDIFPGPWWVSGSQIILRVGEPLSSFYGYRRLGTWNTDEAAEAAEVGRIPGEAKRSEEKEIIGKGIPDWTGSFINRFKYKNFDLSVDLQFVMGVDILQQFFHSTEDRTGYANSLSTVLHEAWTPNNQNTMIQQIRNAPLSGQNSEIDDHWVCDGSYLRGNLISLGYNFDDSFLTTTGFKRLRVYASVENAFVIHSDDFKGFDPEATSWGGNQWGQNMFFFQYPKPRTFTLGVNLEF